MPGQYMNAITMKEYVRIQGAGADQCTITSTVAGADHSTLDGFLLRNLVTCDGVSPTISNCVGGSANILVTNGAAPLIINNDITFRSTSSDAGITVANGSEPEVRNNIIRCSSPTNTSLTGLRIVNGSAGRYIGNKLIGCKIHVQGDTTGYSPPMGPSNPLITNNEVIGPNFGLYLVSTDAVIMNNSFEDVYQYGIYVYNSNPLIMGNHIQAADVIPSTYVGIYLDDNPGYPITIANNMILGSGIEWGVRISRASDPVLVNNVITGHQYDLYLPAGSPKVMFNVFDVISGSAGVGEYNVDSSGVPIAVP